MHHPAGANLVCHSPSFPHHSHTLPIFFIDRQKHIKSKPCLAPKPRVLQPFNERMLKGISWHQPNDQASARVGKSGKPESKITQLKSQLKRWQLRTVAKQTPGWNLRLVHMSELLSVHFFFFSPISTPVHEKQTSDMLHSVCPRGFCEALALGSGGGRHTCSCLISAEMCSENHSDTFASWLPKMWFQFYSTNLLEAMFGLSLSS